MGSKQGLIILARLNLINLYTKSQKNLNTSTYYKIAPQKEEIKLDQGGRQMYFLRKGNLLAFASAKNYLDPLTSLDWWETKVIDSSWEN